MSTSFRLFYGASSFDIHHVQYDVFNTLDQRLHVSNAFNFFSSVGFQYTVRGFTPYNATLRNPTCIAFVGETIFFLNIYSLYTKNTFYVCGAFLVACDSTVKVCTIQLFTFSSSMLSMVVLVL